MQIGIFKKLSYEVLQVLSTLLSLLAGFTGGASITYTAVAVPFYLDPHNDSGLVMTQQQASWFGRKDKNNSEIFHTPLSSQPQCSDAVGW